jgi:hypothetical protein
MSNKGSISFTANGIAVGGNTANVSIDISGANDAIAMPSGHTAERPTGQPGHFRYNKDIQGFEGYSTSWGPIGGGKVTIQANGNVINATQTIDFSNGPNVSMSITDDFVNNRINVFFDAQPPTIPGGTNSVNTRANDIVVLANAFLNFNNTATVNVVAAANGVFESNISFTANGTALGIPAINVTFGTINSTFATVNSTFASINTSLGLANTAYDQANGAYGQANAAYAEANASIIIAENAYATANSRGGLVLAITSANTSNLVIGGNSTNVTIDTRLVGGGGGSNTVGVLANGSFVVNGNVNFNNSSSINTSITANGTVQANVQFAVLPRAMLFYGA